jgi:hypothetical protein
MLIKYGPPSSKTSPPLSPDQLPQSSSLEHRRNLSDGVVSAERYRGANVGGDIEGGESPLNAKKAELHKVIRLSLAGYVRFGADKRGFGRGDN